MVHVSNLFCLSLASHFLVSFMFRWRSILSASERARAISFLTKRRRMTRRDGEMPRVSDISVTIARCRVPDYPALQGELFLRRDSTQAALSRLSYPGKENIKLVPAAFTRMARIPRCHARQSLLHAFFLTTTLSLPIRRRERKKERERAHVHSSRRSVLREVTSDPIST